MTQLIKLKIKLTSLETSYGEIMSTRDSVTIDTEIPVTLANKIKALIREDDIFSVEITGQSEEYSGYYPDF